MVMVFIFAGLCLGWCLIWWAFVAQRKKTTAEINLLPPRMMKAQRSVHPLVGKHLSHFTNRLLLPSAVLQGRSVIVLLSSTCPYCLSTLVEFMEQYQPKYQLPFMAFVQVSAAEEIGKFADIYPDMHMMGLSGAMFQELGLNLVPGFLLIGDDGRISAAELRVQDLERATHSLLAAG